MRFLLLSLLLTACAASPSGPPPPVAVFLGDSHTEGTGADSPESGWAAQAGRMLGWDTHISAIGGTGYVNPGHATTLEARVERDVIALHPTVVVVAAGANDSRYSVDEATAERLGPAAHDLYVRIRAALPQARLIVVGPFWRAAEADDIVRGVDATIQAQADAAGVTFISALDWVQGCPECMWTDGAHFSQAGHDRLARKFVEALR